MRLRLRWLSPVAVVVAGLFLVPEVGAAQTSYWAYVANEASDIVSLVRFDGHEVVEEKQIQVGYHPTDLDGAHGISVSPRGDFWYVSIAHGQPYGQVWQMETGTDRLVDSTTVGLFPATMALTPDGTSLLVVNFNLHGDPVPSSVSAVFTPVMQELQQIETCVMPHGGRVSRDGRRHYSACMMSDQLVEITLASLSVTRRMGLTAGHEGVIEDGAAMMAMGTEGICKPTWVVVSPDDERLYVPCNGRGDVLEIAVESMEVLRRFPTGRGPYNGDITPDGSKLVITLKSDQAVAIFDLETGEETRVPTSQPLSHGVAITPDGRYALVTNEAVGATRGTIDVIDLEAGRLVATTELQYQPGGIGFWKMVGG
jgi:DNA-binding beta-propeller fold protein YncE